MSDYVRLSKANKYLALSGAPVAILSSRDRESFGFRPIANPALGVMISAQEQEIAYNAYMSGQYDVGSPSLIVIGCDALISGQKMAANIAAKYIDDYPTPFPFIKWINLAYHDFKYFQEHTPTRGVVVIPSIDKHCESKRITLANDYIRCSEGSTIIVVIETPDVITYALQNMSLQPDVLIQLGRPVKSRTKF
jgi:hypothetical protein